MKQTENEKKHAQEQEKKIPDKLHQDREAETQKQQKELTRGSNRLGDMRMEIGGTRGNWIRTGKSWGGKRKRWRKEPKTRTVNNSNTRTTPNPRKGREVRRTAQQKGPPPPAPETRTKAPPTSLQDSPTKTVQISHGDNRGVSGEEEHEKIQPPPTDLTKPEHITWPKNRMELAIAELKDDLGAIYRETTAPPDVQDHPLARKTRKILREMANVPTQATLIDLEIQIGAWRSAVVQYINNYLWAIEGQFPAIDANLWGTFEGETMEYFQAFNIRGDAVPKGGERKRHCLTDNRGESNYSFLDYAQRLKTIESESGDANGILVE